MGLFADDTDVYSYLGRVFELALADDDIGPKMRNSGLIMRVVYTEPDAEMIVDMVDAKTYYGTQIPPDLEPTVQLFMKADDGHRFWLGKLNLTMALTKGQVRSKGPLPKMLKLLPLAKPMFAQYEALVSSSGRPEFLEV